MPSDPLCYRNIRSVEHPDLDYLNPNTPVIKQFKEDPIVKSLLGTFMSALNRYDNIHYNSEFIKATMNHDSAKANKITDDHINELRTIHKQINERIKARAD